MVSMVMTMVFSKAVATMKNLFTRLMLVAVAAMGFVACQDGFEDVTIAPEASEVVMTITADADDTLLDNVSYRSKCALDPDRHKEYHCVLSGGAPADLRFYIPHRCPIPRRE